MSSLDDRKRAVDAAIEECRAMPIEDVVGHLQLDMRRVSGWLSGSCPECGGDDRFNINLHDGGFFCRKGCSAKGSGPIDLVMRVQGLEFLKAVEWLRGDLPDSVSDEELARRKAVREKALREKEAKRRKFKEYALNDARQIWINAKGHDRAPLRDYFARRGFSPDMLSDLPGCLRFIPDHPYHVSRKGDDGKSKRVLMHRGPAMIAAIQAPDDRLSCVHQTWFDLSRPQGKALIEWQGEKQRNKLTRGSQNGAAIRLVTPERFSTLVMAEGIETTLTAAVAWREVLGPETAYWAGISLVHMAGKSVKESGQRFSTIPDMADHKGFFPPPWVTRLIFIQDGDSEARSTRAKLVCGLRRAMALNPACQGQIVHAGQGVDLNDVLLGAVPSNQSNQEVF